MNSEDTLDFSKSIFIYPIVFIAMIWIVYSIEIKFQLNLNKYGIKPRDILGLRGVFFTHFIHGDVPHLFNNSVPIFLLLSSLFYFYKEVALKVLILGAILTGLITWIIARPSYHIGASGIVYLLFSFIFLSGIIRRHYRLIALSLIVIFLYGSMIWYVLPVKEGISWEGHLAGLLVGFFFAIVFRKKGIQKETYEFQKTEFDDLFDEDGNLIHEEEVEEG